MAKLISLIKEKTFDIFLVEWEPLTDCQGNAKENDLMIKVNFK